MTCLQGLCDTCVLCCAARMLAAGQLGVEGGSCSGASSPAPAQPLHMALQQGTREGHVAGGCLGGCMCQLAPGAYEVQLC
jgi:hypothetical protein